MLKTTAQQHQRKQNAGARLRGLSHLYALVGYAFLTVVMTWPLARNFTSAIPGDGFDGWQNYWNIWWVKVALVDRIQNPLFTDILYHPTGVGLYFHTLNPFNGLVTLPVQLTAGLIAAYNTVVLISWTLGGYGLFLLTLWVIKRKKNEAPRSGGAPNRDSRPILELRSSIPYLSAFIAGVIFTFSPFHMAHLLGHMQVMSLQWIPFYILYLLMAMTAVREGKPWLRYGVLAGLFLVLTGLCDWYFVLYLFFFTVVAYWWMAVVVVRQGRREGTTGKAGPTPSSPTRGWSWAGRLLRLSGPPFVAGILFVIVLSPWLVPMVSQTIRFDFMERPQSDLYILSASVMDFLTPNRLHTLFRPASFTWIGNQIAPVSERTISIGYLALLLAGVGLFARPRRALFWLAVALIFLLLALGPTIHLGNITWEDIPTGNDTQFHLTPLGILNYFLPIARISRSVSRFALMVQLSVAVLAGLGTAMLLQRLRKRQTQAAVAGLILVILLAESWVAPYPLSPPDTPAYYRKLAADGGSGALLNLPMNYDRPGYLLYQTVHQQPLAVAYISRDDPRTLTERVPVLQHFRHLGPDIIDVDPAAVGQTLLADIGVETVVLDRYKMPGGLEREFTDNLATAIFHGAAPRYEDDRITVYTVAPPSEPLPYLILGEENWGPLTSAAEGTNSRLLAGGPATVTLHHLPGTAQLYLRYRTDPDVSLTLDQGEETKTVVLPSSSDGNEIVVEIVGKGADIVTLELTPSEDGSVWIEKIGLVLP